MYDIHTKHITMGDALLSFHSSTAVAGATLLLRTSPLFTSAPIIPRKIGQIKIRAKLGGGDGDVKRAEKKFITKEQEPEEYWQAAGEREGENPMKTLLPYIIIFGMSTPFVILAIAFANGWIKVPIR